MAEYRTEFCIGCGEETCQYAKYRKFDAAEQAAVLREISKDPYVCGVPSNPLNDAQVAWECRKCHAMNPNDPKNNADIHIAHFFGRR